MGISADLDCLPVYAALQRFVGGRTVVVAGAREAIGARRIKDAGAARVVLVGSELADVSDVESMAGFPVLPLAPQSVDLVVCIEGWSQLSPTDRSTLSTDAHRVLKRSGTMAVWAPHGEPNGLDFFALERALNKTFAEVLMVAHLPWQGVSLTPVLDEADRHVPQLSLEEGLLSHAPEASHYLALAAVEASASEIVSGFRNMCVLVPSSMAPPRDEADRVEHVPEVEARTDAVQGRAHEEVVERVQLDLMRARSSLRAEQLREAKAEARAKASEVVALREVVAQLEHRLDAPSQPQQAATLAALERERDEARAAQDTLGGELEVRTRELERLTTVHRQARAIIEKLRLDLEATCAAEGLCETATEGWVAANTPPADGQGRTQKCLQREIQIRAQEQSVLLTQLDAAEQRVWERTEALGRTEARLAAARAQLDHRTLQLEEMTEALAATRRDLVGAQSRQGPGPQVRDATATDDLHQGSTVTVPGRAQYAMCEFGRSSPEEAVDDASEHKGHPRASAGERGRA